MPVGGTRGPRHMQLCACLSGAEIVTGKRLLHELRRLYVRRGLTPVAAATGGASRPSPGHVESASPFELGDDQHGVRELSVS